MIISISTPCASPTIRCNASIASLAVSAFMEITLSFADHTFERGLHSLLNATRFSGAIQDHADIGLGDTEFLGQIIVGDSLVVHSTDQSASPFLRHFVPPS